MESENPLDLYRQQVRHWRNLWAVTFLVLACFLVLGVYNVAEVRENNAKRDGQIADLRSIAEDIDRATNPEAQARQAEVVKDLVYAVDCNTRKIISATHDVDIPCEPLPDPTDNGG